MEAARRRGALTKKLRGDLLSAEAADRRGVLTLAADVNGECNPRHELSGRPVNVVVITNIGTERIRGDWDQVQRETGCSRATAYRVAADALAAGMLERSE